MLINKNTYLYQKAEECIRKIRSVDFASLGISTYNQQYIRNILPVIDYYFSIYIHTLSLFPKCDPGKNPIIDFGGGHGFLSIFLKSLGFTVIYCDLNERSVDTISKLKDTIDLGPDFIVHGSTPELITFCKINGMTPDYLLATDLIEHVYDLSAFFCELNLLNPRLQMGFSTASNPENHIKSWKLRKYMQKAEVQYLQKRITYISESFLNLNEEEIMELAKRCRGKNYPDIHEATTIYIEQHRMAMELSDRFNTCDPENGNWSERILSLNEYQEITGKYQFNTTFFPGFYNDKRSNPLTSAICKTINRYIKSYPEFGMKIAPYILLKIVPC